MSNHFQRHAIDGGDIGLWGPIEKLINLLGLGTCTAYLYNDGGTLKLGKGLVGLDDGSQQGVAVIDTVTSLSIAALTASLWARVEISRTGTVLNIEITSIAGANDPSALPAGFTGAYDGTKQGYYVTATKRTVGLVWLNAAGAIEGVVNCLNGNAYAGYSQSNDTLDTPYYFLQHNGGSMYNPLNVASVSEAVDMSAADYDQVSAAAKQAYSVTTGAGSNDFNMLSLADQEGCRVRIVKVDTGAGVANVNTDGAETFLGGATAFPLRKQGDFIEYEVVGGVAIVIDSLSTLDSAALDVNQVQNLAHGCAVRLRLVSGYLVNTSTEINYSAGDELHLWPNYFDGAVGGRISFTSDATNLITLTGNEVVRINNKTTAAAANVTMNKWIVRFRYKL